ncbi:MAG TPA: hypothetical protein VEO95_00495 [Chthoniobacteraceae bacterium]|nr:hypothetical protein [Chthoniobacteraceae bacterium]
MKLLALLPLLALPLTLVAADSQPKTLLAERGKVLLSDDLNQAPDGKAWRAAKGKWEAADGAVRGAELAADNHPGVIRHALPFKDAVIQYDVKLDGAKMTTFSINDEKEHVARVLLMPNAFRVQKDDHDHDGPDKAVVFGQRAVKLAPGEWHTVVIEIVGDTMLATLDGRNATFGSHELIATQKANIGFTVSGESISLRNLRVWEAKPNPDWEKTKSTIPPAPVPPAAPAKKPAA